MRSRAAALAAVVAFAVAVTGVAVVAARSGGGSGLERLPFAAGGDERGDAAMSLSAPAGVVEYALGGPLSELPREAPAFRLGDDGASGAAQRVASALGVDPAKVVIERVPGVPRYLSSSKPDSAVSRCVRVALPEGPIPPAPDACLSPPAVADLPSKEEAERIARQTFRKLGVSIDGLELLGGTYAWDATVSPSVGGLPTRGLESGLSIGPKGEITAAHGFLGAPDRIGDYPLVDVQAGYERLQKGVGIGPRPLADREIAIGGQRQPQVVTITGVRLALLHVGDLLVPVFEFLTGEGGAITVPAVVDRWLKDGQQPGGDEPGIDVHSGSGSCAASAAGATGGSDGGKDNQPLTVQVCVEPAKATVGQPVTFTVTAVDPDAPVLDNDCGSPTVAFGDGQPPASNCMTGCTLALPLTPKKTPRQPGKASRTFTHAYDSPGTFTATFGFQSGPCTEWSSSGEGSIDVVVVS